MTTLAGPSPAARRGWLLLSFLLLAGCGGGRPWNVLLVTLDTTRADFLGCYGKESARTPNFDRLAAEGTLFEHAYASNPVTQASHSTILTGVYPLVHGVRDNGLFRLPEARDTLAELLKARGYATAAAVGGFPLTAEFGTHQGFDLYDDDLTADRLDHRGRPVQRSRRTWYDERPAGHVNDAILPWLRQLRDEPFFVWLHYWDPHEPHIAPAPYGQLFAHDPYQGEIAYADESLGTILRQLEASGELGRTLVVVTADHGESRYEHNEVTHAFLAYDTTLHVPLIVRPPGKGGRGIAERRIAERVGTVDIVPTVLDLLGFELPQDLQGRSLAPLTRGAGGGGSRRPYYSESMSPRLSHGVGELRVLFLGPWKYIHGPRPELFHLDDDPRELRDLVAERPQESERMEAALGKFLAEHASPEAADATFEAGKETRRRLAALGYLSTAAGEGPEMVTEEFRPDGAAPQDRVVDINLQSRLRRELSQGAFHQARRTAERLVALAPDNPFYRGSLASALLGLGEVEEAARVVDGSRNVSAANLDPFFEVAQGLFDAGEPERGIALAHRLVDAEETATGRVTLARMLRDSGDGAGFLAAVERALELDDGHRGARLELARHLAADGEPERAEVELRRLLAAYPVDFEGHLAYGRLLRESGRGEAALERIERVLRLAPLACEAHLERVTVLAELGRREDAGRAVEEMGDRCRDREMRDRAAALVAGL